VAEWFSRIEPSSFNDLLNQLTAYIRSGEEPIERTLDEWRRILAAPSAQWVHTLASAETCFTPQCAAAKAARVYATLIQYAYAALVRVKMEELERAVAAGDDAAIVRTIRDVNDKKLMLAQSKYLMRSIAAGIASMSMPEPRAAWGFLARAFRPRAVRERP
jgi:hypothetical protein